jgi:hypothetical protein
MSPTDKYAPPAASLVSLSRKIRNLPKVGFFQMQMDDPVDERDGDGSSSS